MTAGRALVYGSVMGNERGERAGSVVVAIVATAAVVTGIYATLVAGIYFWVVLSWPNSVGERVGILQRFSTKGWICKTHEGELAISIVPPDVTPVIWHFSVRDESVLPRLTEALGKRVVLHYREHRGLVTSCFGETRYFVTGVRVAE